MTTINASTAVGVVSGVLQQVPISTLDAIMLTPNLDNLNDGALYARVVETALTSNQIDSTKSGFRSTYGSVPSTVVGNTASIFSYTSTSTTAAISWSSFTLYFSDGTTVTVSSGSQSVTGLTAGTYFYYPYVASGATTVSFVTGGSGSPGILFSPQNATAAQTQNGQSVTALSVGSVTIVVMTGGSGSGGGSGRCIKSSMKVMHRERGIVSIGSCGIGDFILSRNGEYTEIVQYKLVPHRHFVRFTTSADESVSVTHSHHITVIRDGEESVPAAMVNLKDFVDLER